MNTKKQVEIYTDGACSGNPGPGGWAAILCYGEHRKEICGHMPGTTNNRMELFAAISGLGELKTPCSVALFSDSAYLINAFGQKWVDKWQQNGWKTSQGTMVENQDLWRLLLTLTKRHDVSFHKVKGHADHPENNRCDELARAQVKEYMRLNNLNEEISAVPKA